MSVLACFSKFWKMYLTDNGILYKKQFGFQDGHSTERAVVELGDRIINSFESNHYTLGVFVDLPKAFDTANHKIRKLRNQREELTLVYKLLNELNTVHKI